MVELKANGEIRTANVTKINEGPEGALFSFKSELMTWAWMKTATR